MITTYQIKDLGKIRGIIRKIDLEFFPPISVQEKSIDDYADRLAREGKVLVSEDKGKINAIVGYFMSDVMTGDLLWVDKSRRNTRLLYALLRQVVKNEDKFNGIVRAKTWSTNEEMKGVLRNLGFRLREIIPADFVPERTSFVYEIDFNEFKQYFTAR